MSDIEGRGFRMLRPPPEKRSPRLRRPTHHRSVRVGISSRRAWISFAGVLLLLSAGVGFYTSAQLFVQASEAQQPGLPGGVVEVAGVVTDPLGNTLDGALVSILETGNETQTNADGWYTFGEIPPGSYTFEASFAGHQTVSKPVVLESSFPRLIAFSLPPGTGSVEVEGDREPNFSNPAAGAYALAVAVLFASGMAAAGGLSAVRHRHYLIAVTGAAAGVLTLGYFIGTVASIVALAILASRRHGFREAEYHRLPWEEAPEDFEEPTADTDTDGEPRRLPPPPGAVPPPVDTDPDEDAGGPP